MNRQEILNTIKSLSSSQGFYGRLYMQLSDDSEEVNEYLDYLESQNFKDPIDLIMFLEG